MRFMILIKATADSEAGQLPSAELLDAMGKYNQELIDAGVMLAGDGLHPSREGARVRFAGNRHVITDGPFIETKELIAGCWIWQVDSLQHAIEWIKRCPNPMPGHEAEVEIRRVYEPEDFGDLYTDELRAQEDALHERLTKGG